MTHKDLIVTTKYIPDTLVAGVRFLGKREEIRAHLEKIHALAKPYINGSAVVMYHAGDSKNGYDIEVCLPVSQVVEADELKTRTLQGGDMLCATHLGPHDHLMETWKLLSAYIRTHDIGMAEDPGREVYLEDVSTHGDDVEKYVVEIQVPLLLSKWLNRLADGLDHYVNEEIRAQVLAGSEDLSEISTPRERAIWVQGSMERLDAAVNDEEARYQIMTGCSQRFPQERILQLKKVYQETGSVDSVLETMSNDQSWQGASFYEDPEREGYVINVEKIPYDRERFENASDEIEKKVAYCHCPFVRGAIRDQMDISPTFCGCGAGWYRQLWVGILDMPTPVETLETVLHGGERCKFAIHLPVEGK
ncbi:MAG: GyrI-like domain-containing protein, partial [Anaerolineaceae bacterium]|nr:GyrI-like domain-containing protein [Anaerolineaceae bacterium]